MKGCIRLVENCRIAGENIPIELSDHVPAAQQSSESSEEMAKKDEEDQDMAQPDEPPEGCQLRDRETPTVGGPPQNMPSVLGNARASPPGPAVASSTTLPQTPLPPAAVACQGAPQQERGRGWLRVRMCPALRTGSLEQAACRRRRPLAWRAQEHVQDI